MREEVRRPRFHPSLRRTIQKYDGQGQPEPAKAARQSHEVNEPEEIERVPAGQKMPPTPWWFGPQEPAWFSEFRQEHMARWAGILTTRPSQFPRWPRCI